MFSDARAVVPAGKISLPVMVSPALATLSVIRLVIVVAKFGSLPKATASSLRVFRASGDESTKADIAAATKAVVAICVEFVPDVAVGAVGVPVKAGEASGAYPWALTKAVVEILVLLSPVDGVGAVGVPVKVGEPKGAHTTQLAQIP